MKKIDNSTATVDNLFTDGDPAVPTPATTFPAWYINMIQYELVKIVEMAGITLDPTADDFDPTKVNQIAEALAVHVAGLDYYNDTGAADAYVLSVIGADEAQNTEPAYFDGMRVRFLPDNDNTGAATVRVGSQAIKNIKEGAGAGADPAAARIVAGVMTELYYDETNDVFKFAQNATSTPAFEGSLLHIQDQKASGTSGGNASSGRNQRVLNTVLTNEITGASLSSNAITLPAGTYFIMASAPAYQTGDGQVVLHQLILEDTTGAADLLEGTSEYLNGSSADALQTRTFLTGRFTLSVESVLNLDHYFSSAETDGLGQAVSAGNGEVYSDVLIWKVA